MIERSGWSRYPRAQKAGRFTGMCTGRAGACLSSRTGVLRGLFRAGSGHQQRRIGNQSGRKIHQRRSAQDDERPLCQPRARTCQFSRHLWKSGQFVGRRPTIQLDLIFSVDLSTEIWTNFDLKNLNFDKFWHWETK